MSKFFVLSIITTDNLSLVDEFAIMLNPAIVEAEKCLLRVQDTQRDLVPSE